MDRLTWRDKRGVAHAPIGLPCYIDVTGISADRLAAYEDTNLTPDEITAALSGLEEMQDLVGTMPLCIGCEGKIDGVRTDKCDYDTTFTKCAKQALEIHNKLSRLAEYDAAERDGRLVRLPCKVGDTVYVIPSKTNRRLNIATKLSANNRVYEQRVESVKWFNNFNWCISTCDGVEVHRAEAFGKTVFLTHAEAAAAMKG